MQGLMMDYPFSISSILDHGYRVAPTQQIVSILPSKTRHQYSYGELYRRSKKLAHALINKLGVKKGEMVGTYAWNTYQHLELYFGIPGAAAVCHTIKIRLSASQTEFIVNNAEDRYIFIDVSLVAMFEQIAPALATVRRYILLNAADGFKTTLPDWMHYEDLIADAPDDGEWESVNETDACAMCYTSGTTGLPKGVLYSHRSVCMHTIITSLPNYLNIGATDRIMLCVPQFHVMAWGLPFAAIMAGAFLVMPSSHLQPEAVVEIMSAERVYKAVGVPTIWQGIYHTLKKKEYPSFPLKEFMVGGAAMPPSLIDAFQKEFNIRAIHAWGMTETSPVATLSRLRPHHEILPEAEKIKIRSMQGQPLPFNETRVVLENGDIAPADGKTVGEIQTRGSWVIRDYFKSGDRDSFTADGWFKTGDVGTMNAEGYLMLTDRIKDLIKSGGEWISSVALELAIMAHPKVKEAAVIAIPDETWSERPLAAIVLKDAAVPLAVAEIREFLSVDFVRYQIPDKYLFVPEIPKTSVGKFDKKEMRRLYAEGKWQSHPNADHL